MDRKRKWSIMIITGLMIMMVFVLIMNQEIWNDSVHKQWDEKIIQGHGDDKILQLFVKGSITDSDGLGQLTSSSTLISQINQAIEDHEIKAIVMRIDSPGGDVVASDEVHMKLKEFKQTGKLYVVSMGSMAASGGYYISAPADRIFANPSTLTGSIGVVFSIPNYQEAADRLGYKEQKFTSGQFKTMGDPLQELTTDEREILQNIVDESYERFIHVVSEGRNLPLEQVKELADGRIYTGQQALELGLIDAFGTLETATDYIIERLGLSEARIVQYKEPFSFSSLLFNMPQSFVLPWNEWVNALFPESAGQPSLKYQF